MNEKGVLGSKIHRGGHDIYRIEKKCEYMGLKFNKGDYISRDGMHHEWEWFRGGKEHRGAIDPITGKVKPGSIDKSRMLKF